MDLARLKKVHFSQDGLELVLADGLYKTRALLLECGQVEVCKVVGMHLRTVPIHPTYVLS